MTAKQAKKLIGKKPMPKSLKARFIANGLSDRLESVCTRTSELFSDNAAASKALYTHLEQILPCIAYYEELIAYTDDKEQALKLYDEWAFDRLEKLAKMFRKVMQLPALYKKVPKLGERLIDSVFGSDAGFQSRKAEGAAGFARDMTVCPYYETCKKYGCPELTQFFCKSDDITYGSLHPKLIWGRTQTLGTGGECCDFRLYVREE